MNQLHYGKIYFRHFKKTQMKKSRQNISNRLNFSSFGEKPLIFLTTAGSEILCIWGFCFVLKQVQKEEMKQNEIFPR